MELNKRFYTFHKKKRPYIILKWAQTSDGFIAPVKQKKETSYPISNIQSQKISHKWRAQESGIIIGKNTVIKDNPHLTTRLYNGKNPIRIILDNNLEISNNYNIFNCKTGTIIFNKKINKSSNNLDFIKVKSTYNLNNILYQLYKKKNLS